MVTCGSIALAVLEYFVILHGNSFAHENVVNQHRISVVKYLNIDVVEANKCGLGAIGAGID